MNEEYIKTSIGLLPKDWSVLKAGEIFSNHTNKNHKGNLEVLSATQDRGIIPRSQLDIDIKYDMDSLKNYKKVEPGDFVISLRSFQGGIEYSKFEGLVSPAYTVLKNEIEIDGNFYKYLFKKEDFITRLNSVIYGIRDGKQIGYNDFKDLKVQYPPLEEQRKISSILSTWDKAIELKEKLIEQKKQQKKGLMQKLLTGEVRLPGFKGKWKEVRIKDLGTLKGGSAFPEKYQNVISGKYPFFKVSDMNNEENEKYMLNANNYINEEIRSEIKATIIPKNSIIFAKVGAALLLERKRILKYDSCIDNNMMALIVKENIDFNYVYYLLLNMKLSRFSNVGALPSLNSNDVYSLKCRLPMDYDEQKAVAELLSLFDKEIDLLQNELIQIKQQKKGLMQLLLTGKVRVKV
ncbi:restriction endonuclease subunit S [Heyndrickxia sp. FSL W8-0423]|uniref:restriction endonuclease subunit S n=2 Tax=Heyndrickxia TaxID=2837504 RepID=UPI0030F4B488